MSAVESFMRFLSTSIFNIWKLYLFSYYVVGFILLNKWKIDLSFLCCLFTNASKMMAGINKVLYDNNDITYKFVVCVLYYWFLRVLLLEMVDWKTQYVLSNRMVWFIRVHELYKWFSVVCHRSIASRTQDVSREPEPVFLHIIKK